MFTANNCWLQLNGHLSFKSVADENDIPFRSIRALATINEPTGRMLLSIPLWRQDLQIVPGICSCDFLLVADLPINLRDFSVIDDWQVSAYLPAGKYPVILDEGMALLALPIKPYKASTAIY